MKIFNIALQINKKDISITLIENSKLTPKINLGGVEYYINYSGIEYFEAVKKALQDYFKDSAIPVTKQSLENCLAAPSLCIAGYTSNVTVSSTKDKLQRALKHAAQIGKGLSEIEGGYSEIWLLPLGGRIPSSIPKNVILIEMVGLRVTTHTRMGSRVLPGNKLYLSQAQIAEIASDFPPIGEDPKIISTKNNQELFNKIALMCGYMIENRQAKDLESKKPLGRMILDSYFVEVQENQAGKFLSIQQMLLSKAKKFDQSTSLSLPEWAAFKKNQWEKSDKAMEFFPWLMHETWKNTKTTDDYFTWFLRDDHKTFNIPAPFEKFKEDVTNHVLRSRSILGKDVSDADVINFAMEHITSGSNLSDNEYFQYKQWKKVGSDDNFERWSMRQAWEKLPKPEADKTEEKFVEWEANKLGELLERWNKSGMEDAGIPFDQWRKQQDDTLLTDTGDREFIRCDEKNRERYQLHITESGNILRNNKIYNTEYETTLHSGKGYAIFVIGPNQEVYAASHIPRVFHHSSFFADGAVLAGGEIRMGLGLSVNIVKNSAEKDQAIKKFRKNNNDPYNIHFIQNASSKSWTIVGEDELGNVKNVDIKSDSALGITLKDIDLKKISFSKRTEILDQAAKILDRPNNKNQITLLSSKSGHYHPEDEENYFMLKYWQKQGIDLTKIPFTCFMGFGVGAQTFRNAQEYINKVEPTIQARDQARLSVSESGLIQNSNQQILSEMNATIVINKKGDCYLSDHYEDFFTHPKIVTAESKQVLKSDIVSEIKKLEERKAHSISHINELSRLIKDGKKSHRNSRRANKEAELLNVSDIDKSIARLKKIMHESPRLGKQEIQGGGIVTTNANGEITKIDTKLGSYTLSEKEVETTLQSLQRRGIKLDAVELVTYNSAGESQNHPNASLYLTANKPKPIISHAGSHQKKETENEFNFNKASVLQNSIASTVSTPEKIPSFNVIEEEVGIRWREALDKIRNMLTTSRGKGMIQDNKLLAQFPHLLKYQLEKLDPLHRDPGYLFYMFEKWNASETKSNFYTWLDSNVNQNQPPVKQVDYLTDSAKYEVTFDEKGRASQNGLPFDTTRFGGKQPGFAVFVVDPETEKMYAIPYEYAKQHHSTLLSGNRVLTAGLAKFENGELQAFSLVSGHYDPGLTELKNSFRYFNEHKVDLSKTTFILEHGAFLDRNGYRKFDISDVHKCLDDSGVPHTLIYLPSHTEYERMVSNPIAKQNNSQSPINKMDIPVENEPLLSKQQNASTNRRSSSSFAMQNSVLSFSSLRCTLFNTKKNNITNPNMETRANEKFNDKEVSTNDGKNTLDDSSKNSSKTPRSTKR